MNPEDTKTSQDTILKPVSNQTQATPVAKMVGADNQAVTPEEPMAQNDADKKLKSKFLILTAVSLVFFVAAIVTLIVVFAGPKTNKDTVPTTDSILKTDVNALGLAIINFRNGSEVFEITPPKVAQLKLSYIPQDFNDPRTDQPYVLTTAIPKTGELQYIIGGACRSDDSIMQTSDNTNFAIRALLEDNTLYCLSKPEVKQVSQ